MTATIHPPQDVYAGGVPGATAGILISRAAEDDPHTEVPCPQAAYWLPLLITLGPTTRIQTLLPSF